MSLAEPLSADVAASAQAHTRAVALRSGSSFLLGMRILPQRRRNAMYAIYAFCREVDDIADEAGRVEQQATARAVLCGLARRRVALVPGRELLQQHRHDAVTEPRGQREALPDVRLVVLDERDLWIAYERLQGLELLWLVLLETFLDDLGERSTVDIRQMFQGVGVLPDPT